MLNKIAFIASLLFLVYSCAYSTEQTNLSEDDIKELLIAESIATYPGTCPCPYNTTKKGRSCGKRSAYNKPGGYSPLCYKSDVSQAMIVAYKDSLY